MDKSQDKKCPRCGADFICKENDILHCQCAGIQLSNTARTFLQTNYKDCLCRKCLLEINKLFLLCIILLSVACSKQPQSVQPRSGNRYATGFELIEDGDLCTAIVYSPWEEGVVMCRYVISKPYEKLAITSCTHAGFLNELGETDRIVGVCNPELVYTPLKYAQNIGDAMSPNVEKIIATKAQAIIVSTYAQDNATNKQLQKLSIPVIYNNEWTEKSPLARAEWIRFMGALVGKKALADSIFAEIESNYLALCQISKKHAGEKEIMSGQSFRGTWYVPGGDSFMGILFQDAGAKYKYANNDKDSSIPLSIEQALQDFEEADVWVGTSALSLEELRLADEKHQWLKSYQTHEVYNYLGRTTPTGGNDFWERGVVHPEEILSDLLLALYNEGDQFAYSQKLTE